MPENLVSRDGFGRPSRVSLLILHTQTELGAYPRDFSRLPRRRPFMYTANRHRVSPEFIRSRICVPMAFTAESPSAQDQYSPQNRYSNGFCLFRLSSRANQCAPLFSHTHYWYGGVGMLIQYSRSSILLGSLRRPQDTINNNIYHDIPIPPPPPPEKNATCFFFPSRPTADAPAPAAPSLPDFSSIPAQPRILPHSPVY